MVNTCLRTRMRDKKLTITSGGEEDVGGCAATYTSGQLIAIRKRVASAGDSTDP